MTVGSFPALPCVCGTPKGRESQEGTHLKAKKCFI